MSWHFKLIPGPAIIVIIKAVSVVCNHHSWREDKKGIRPDPSGDSLSVGFIILIAAICTGFSVGIVYAISQYFGAACCYREPQPQAPGYHELGIPSYRDALKYDIPPNYEETDPQAKTIVSQNI
ncbi:uncharacterized protein LOC134818592 [Bolinopsis microptera]|uniref:uncharacterized protein LOC134818592 n=1 Tax=Bolinopsis microptera TaxID=2820187 RepID=UPI00307A897D